MLLMLPGTCAESLKIAALQLKAAQARALIQLSTTVSGLP
jgi:hypothetical protein